MIQLSRRGFLGGALAFSAGCRMTSFFGETPSLRFGVVSDIHITTPESADVFRRTLVYFRDCGVDAILVAGDLTDWGLVSGLETVAKTWYDVFPNDRAPDGRKVEKLFCTGNHDYEGWWYGDMTLDMHAQGYSEKEALVRVGLKETWERVFHEPFADVRRRTVKGYDFISAEWNSKHSAAKKWFDENASTLDPNKPFFFFTHYPIGRTTAPTLARDGRYADIPALHRLPQAVAISGHCHWTLNDERSIWQGDYTALAVPSESYTSMPSGYENGSDSRKGVSTRSMRILPARWNLEEAQGFVVSVFPDRMEIERRDFTRGEEAAPAWIVTPPKGAQSRYAFERSAARTPVPQFPAGASVRTFTANGETRNNHWTIMMETEFPSAVAEGGRVYDYVIRAEAVEDGRVMAERRFLAPAFYKLESDEPPRQRFSFDADALPQSGAYRLVVRARNCFGAESRPIRSAVMESCPGGKNAKRT